MGERAARRGPAGALELEVVRIFEEVLQARDVGIHDSFFDLGGHSLLALKLKLALEERLSRPVWSPCSRARPRSSWPRRSGARRRTRGAPRPLIPLTPAARALLSKGSAAGPPPLFLIPGGFSTPFYLLPLAQRLDGRAVFGIHTRGLDGQERPHERLEEAAAWIEGAITSVQPEGPYYLGGHSIGGHLAYEVAQQLRERSREVGLVALLDTLAPFPEATRPIGAGWDSVHWMAHVAEVMESFFSASVGLDPAELRALDEPQRLEMLVARLKGAGILPAAAGPAHVRGILEVARAQDGMRYRPRLAHRLPLAVFTAEEHGKGSLISPASREVAAGLGESPRRLIDVAVG